MSDEKLVVKENIRLHEKEARKYEESKTEIFNCKEQNRLESTLRQAIKNIETGTSEINALDVGCGTGNMINNLVDVCHKVTGLDISRDMLSVALSNHLEERDDVHLVRGRAANIPFPDDTFDIVTAYSFLHHLPSFSGPISEMARVLKPKGVLYIDHEPIERDNPFVKFYLTFCDALNKDATDEVSEIDRQFCDYQIHHGDGGVPLSKILNLCEQNKLEILKTKKYLAYRLKDENPAYPIVNRLMNSEWLLISRKKCIN